MRRARLLLVGVVLSGWVAGISPSAGGVTAQPAGPLPLFFVENRGQFDSRYAFAVYGSDSTAFLGRRGITFTFPSRRAASRAHSPRGEGLELTAPARPAAPTSLIVQFVGANPAAQLRGRAPTPTVVSYFQGHREDWRAGLPTYGEVVYRGLWAGVDLVLSGQSGRLKYTFVVAPGADSARIQLAYRGARHLRITPSQRLEVSGPAGTFTEDAPVVYQERGGRRLFVRASYELTGPIRHGFVVGSYDRTQPLIIDPSFPVYAGFLGRSGNDRGLGIAVDAAGAAYVTGQTASPATGIDDVYVAKIRPDGTGFVFVALIHGSNLDEAFDIAVDETGASYVTGVTASANFPVVVGPDLTFNGIDDAFVLKLSPTAMTLIFSGYVGGRGVDFAEGIAVDASHNVFLTGPVSSNEASFPVMVGPDTTFNGRLDTFIAKMKAVPNDPSPRQNFFYNGYVGGSGDDIGLTVEGGTAFLTAGHVAVDAAGNAYVSGITDSTEATFPDGDGFGAVPGPDQTQNGGDDAYVVKVNPAGTGLVYAGYVGGSGNDQGFGMAVDADGSAYFTGNTDSTEATFPVTVGPDLTFNGGELDTFVAKVAPDGGSLVYAGYLGGSDLDQGLGVTIDGSGSLYVIGHTHSSEATFPVVNGPDSTFNGMGVEGDAFVTKVRPLPSDPNVINNLDFSGYIGGSGEDAAFWVRLDPSGSVYIVGDTASGGDTFPDGDGFGTLTTFDSTNAGGFDAFVIKITNA